MSYAYCKNGHFIGCSYCNDADEECPLCELQVLVDSLHEEAEEGCMCCGRVHQVSEAVERAEKFLANNPPKTPEELAPKKTVLCWCKSRRRPHEFGRDCSLGISCIGKGPTPKPEPKPR